MTNMAMKTKIMSVELDVQYSESQAEAGEEPPTSDEFQLWVDHALRQAGDAQVSIRIVDEAESQSLNKRYRGKDYPTNVLSFPMDIPEALGIAMLGDLVICAPVVEREARDQHKDTKSHWAHMVIHGMLHLQGYDHVEDEQAEEMERLEIQLMQQLGYTDPYGND